MLTDDELKKIESWAGRHSSPFAYSAGANIKETLQLVDDHRALTARVAELKREVKELEAEQEKAWNAMGEIAEYLEHSVTADDWELHPDVKNWLAECLEAKREMDADDRRSSELFDARMTMSYDPNDPTFKGLETGTFSSANSRCRGCGLPMLEHLGANCLTAWKRKAQNLGRQRDEKAQWVAALQAKLAHALAVCNDDLSKMQALTAERNAARKALADVRQWFEAHDFQPDEQFSDSNTVAAITAQEQEHDKD